MEQHRRFRSVDRSDQDRSLKSFSPVLFKHQRCCCTGATIDLGLTASGKVGTWRLDNYHTMIAPTGQQPHTPVPQKRQIRGWSVQTQISMVVQGNNVPTTLLPVGLSAAEERGPHNARIYILVLV